ncbi:hypothetical protein ACEPPN_002310 [Leptodophora sp. 'Broadleaf-Isolate-01']
MPDPMAYKHEAILRSTTDTPAPSAPSVPEPTVNYQPMSMYERGSARQRARLGVPIIHGPIPTTCRKYGYESPVENIQPETITEITDSESGNSPESILSEPTSETTSSTVSESPEPPSPLSDQSNSPDAQQVVPPTKANSAVKRKRTMSESCLTSNKRPAHIQLQSNDMVAGNYKLQQVLLNISQQTGDKNGPIVLDEIEVPPQSGGMNCTIILDEVEVPQTLLSNVSQDPKSAPSTASSVIYQATNQNPGANPPKKRVRVIERRLPIALSEIAMGFTSKSNPLQAFNRARRMPGTDIQPVLQAVEYTTRDIMNPIQESVSKILGNQQTIQDPIDSTSRLFNIPELQWLAKKANEGLVRGKRHGIPIDDLSYEFRQRYCWSFEPKLGLRINNILCKLQKTPDYFQSSQAPEKSPFFEGTRWQTVYLQIYLENGQTIGHKYSLDTTGKWKYSVKD